MCDLLVYLDVLNTFVPEDHLFLHNMLHFIIPCNKLQGFFYFFLHFFGQFFSFSVSSAFSSRSGRFFAVRIDRLFTSPFFNIGMMPGHQYLRHFSVMPYFRSGILRIFQQIILKALELGGHIIMKYPRNQPGYRIDHDHCRKLTSCQDIISDRYIICNDLFQHTFINAFVMTAQNTRSSSCANSSAMDWLNVFPCGDR